MENILFLNHKQKQCGVYQYGYRSARILKKSTKYNFIYCELENEAEFEYFIKKNNPYAIIYNYHPTTMDWLHNQILKKYPHIFHFGLHHEGHQTALMGFNYYITNDCTFEDQQTIYSVPRPLIEDCDFRFMLDPNGPLQIGSFGFGFQNKGFQRLVKTVNEQFDSEDNIQININIPFAYYGDSQGEMATQIARECQSYITKSNIKLNITHNFFTDIQLLSFLATNDINCFFYDEMPGRGLSSVIDYALSVARPIAITNTYMFRHICNSIPSICIENSSFMELLNQPSDPLKSYKENWSNNNFISKYEYIISKANKN